MTVVEPDTERDELIYGPTKTATPDEPVEDELEHEESFPSIP